MSVIFSFFFFKASRRPARSAVHRVKRCFAARVTDGFGSWTCRQLMTAIRYEREGRAPTHIIIFFSILNDKEEKGMNFNNSMFAHRLLVRILV